MRSILVPGKFDELTCIVATFKTTLHVIVLTETWIKDEHEAHRLHIPNYTHYYNFRTTSKGGGASIYVHNNLAHHFLDDEHENGNHFLWIRLEKLSLDIGAIYKPPVSNVKKFLETYAVHLAKRKRALVFGDINLDLLTKNKCKEYKILLKENGFRVLNKVNREYSTRITETTSTIPDHVCTTLQDNTFHMAIVESSMADHKQIYLEMKRIKPERPKSIQYEKIDYDNLYKTIEQTLSDELHNEYLKLETFLLQAISNNKSTKTKKLYPPRTNWINKNLLESINKRNTLWHNLKQSPDDNELREEFMLLKSTVHKDIQGTKSQYYYKAFQKCEKDPLKTWQLINNLASNKIKQICTPNKLMTPAGPITDTQEICECFNSFFSTIGSELANKIPKMYHYDPNTTKLPHTHPSAPHPSLERLKLATVDEVIKIINNLDTNTSSGIDGISTKVIKRVKLLLADNLTQCINRCLDEGQFPGSLKIAKVSPIYKTGNKLDPGNYRPISVLPTLSKIFEKILHNRLSEFLTSINFLYEKQYGFRPKSNTLTATNDLVTSIKLTIDSKKIALGIFIDLKKAFDTVSHQILLSKLKNLGITGAAYKIFESYLTDRYQIVRIDGHQSVPQLITYGVPQGSILGPLLFLTYINDIHEIGLKGDITLYADDTSLFYTGDDIISLVEQAQDDLEVLHTWLQTNLLTINTAKTNYIIFTAKNKTIKNYKPLTINDQPINEVKEEKYLGLILDSQLSWKPHINNIRSKLTSLTGALRGIVRCLPKQVCLTIYNSLVKSHLDYLIEVWGSAAKTNLKSLQIAQNKIIKRLFHYNYLTRTKKIYKETKLMNITQMYKFNTCLLIRKILTRDIHSKIIFTKKKNIQNRLTRQANNINLSKARTNYGKRNIMFEGVQFYNKLPKDLKSVNSLFTFKKLLKNHILKDFSLLE